MATEFLATADILAGPAEVPTSSAFAAALNEISYKLKRLAELNGVPPNTPATATWTLVCNVKTGEPPTELKAGTE